MSKSKGQTAEAAVHTSLPPLVAGPVRGHVKVCLTGPVEWECPVRPPVPKLSVRLRWWGEKGVGTLFRVPVKTGQKVSVGHAAPNMAHYAIQASLPQFTAYLKDMGAVAFEVGLGHMTNPSMVIGRAVVPDLVALTSKREVSGSYSILSSGDIHLGQLPLSFELQTKTGSHRKTKKQSTPKKGRKATKAEFTVGPGPTFKQKASSKLSPRSTHRQQASGDVTNRRGYEGLKGAIEAVAPMERLVEDHPKWVPVTVMLTKPESPPVAEAPALPLGKQQREVISQLLAKGSRLRDKMLDSLASGSAGALQDQLRVEREVPTSSVLSLVSAELALKKQGELRGDVVYDEHSSSDDGVSSPTSTIVSQQEEDMQPESHSKPLLSPQFQPSAQPSSGSILLSKFQSRDPHSSVGMQSSYTSTQPSLADTRSSVTRTHSLAHSAVLSDRTSLLNSSGSASPHHASKHKHHPSSKHHPSGKHHPSKKHHPSRRRLLSGVSMEKTRLAPLPEEDRSSTSESEQFSRSVARSSGSEQYNTSGAVKRLSVEPTRKRLAGPVAETLHCGGAESAKLEDGSAGEGESGVSTEEEEEEEEENMIHMKRGRITSASLQELVNVFGRAPLPSEQELSESMGVEQLTRVGRATSARVIVDSLELNPVAINTLLSQECPQDATKDPSPALRATYFVEYQFPAAVLASKRTSSKHQHLHEVMRVACKKMKDGEVVFKHRSVFPVLPNSKVLQSWWNSSLIFRVYCRPSKTRMPVLVGKAVVALRAWLTSPSLQCLSSLPVHRSTMSEALQATTTTQSRIGKLKVCLELLVGKQVFPPLDAPPPLPGAGGPLHEPVKLQENVPPSAGHVTDSAPNAGLGPLQMLLLIPEAIQLVCPPSHPEALPDPPNSYLLCKLPVFQTPPPRTPIQWTTENPQFLFRQMFPLVWSKSLVDNFCNNFCVVEVWHRSSHRGAEDQLLGLVKLSLHQFYLDFSDADFASLTLHSQLPTVAVEAYCPIVDPISGHTSGHLGVLLALGSPDQVSYLLRQHAAGHHPLQRPHVSPQSSGTFPLDSLEGEEDQPVQAPPPTTPPNQPTVLYHEFKVRVEGVRDLEVASSTVWGEADCFIQYHFPTLPDNSEGSTELSLFPYRTPCTLYMPSPSFAHETLHQLRLPVEHPVGQALVSACGRGMSSQISFELWRRFYFPNIRDQLLAKAELAVVKVCALVVGTHRKAVNSSQTFSLPLKALSSTAPSVGVLDVSVSYKGSQWPKEQSVEDPVITLSLGVVRVAGLQRAAVMASRDHPLPLDFAAEVGVNPYIKMSTAHIIQEPHTSKMMPKCFAAEFCQFFQVPLQLSSEGERSKDGRGNKGGRRDVGVASLLQTSLLCEVWHRVPKREAASTVKSSSGVVGRRLGPSFSDVLLGVAHVPLWRLLMHTGVHGWYPLLPLPRPTPLQCQAPPLYLDRELVVWRFTMWGE